jgi:hypothetical protein
MQKHRKKKCFTYFQFVILRSNANKKENRFSFQCREKLQDFFFADFFFASF